MTLDIANNAQLVDDTFNAATPVNQVMGDTASAGTVLQVSRGNHRHGMPNFGTPVSVSTAIGNGASANVARSDHVHDLASALGAPVSVGTALASGTAATAARSDHVHDLVDDVVTAAKLKDDATVDANRAVTSDHIRDAAIVAAKIAAGAVGKTKLAAGMVVAMQALTLSNNVNTTSATAVAMDSTNYKIDHALAESGNGLLLLTTFPIQGSGAGSASVGFGVDGAAPGLTAAHLTLSTAIQTLTVTQYILPGNTSSHAYRPNWLQAGSITITSNGSSVANGVFAVIEVKL